MAGLAGLGVCLMEVEAGGSVSGLTRWRRALVSGQALED